MRRLRRQRPGAQWFVSVRCARAQFRLRPDETRTETIAYFLGAALERFPEVRLVAVLAMSNHLHLCLIDGAGQLADFMCYLLGPMAREFNEMDGVRGQFFDRRYSATEIVDDDAMLDRIVYTVANPVASSLVATVKDWTGLCLWQRGVTTREASRFRKRAYERAVVRARDGKQVAREDYVQRVQINVTPLAVEGRDIDAELDAAIADRVKSLGAQRGRRRVLGMAGVLARSVFAAPAAPKRSPMPVCHASSPERWLAFRAGWRRLVASYRAASELFRSGDLTVPFPEYTFRPPTPLLV